VEGGVLLLCSDNPASRIIFHFLRGRFGDIGVIMEEPVSQLALVRRRLSRLGPKVVAGQLLFRALVVPWLTWRSRLRIAEIVRDHGLDDRPMEGVQHVPSMNDENARAVVRALRPAITVVCGTRILDRETLAALNGPVVNFHAGITPLYRGVHGGYWARAEGRPDLVGSTLHLIDAGIDTGSIVAQTCFEVSPGDNFATYPYLHVAAVLEPLADVVAGALAGEEVAGKPPREDLESKLRTHPTLGQYLRHARAGVH
jgi:folate-dependent phosphoribosylglycinamide formyltransferase PurN